MAADATRVDARPVGFGRWLPPVALAVLLLSQALILAVAGETWGYDFQAYRQAAERLLAGEPLYDPSVDVAGGFAIYLYPPPFAVAFVPFALLPPDAALWLWTALLVGAFVGGTLLLPVAPTTRWLVILLGGLMWPVLYSVKLGQVGPLLYFAFAVGWRWLDEPIRLGGSIAAGAIVKLQPALLFGWALVTGRWRAVAVGLGLVVASVVVSVLALPAGTWADYVALLGRVSSPVTTPHNFTPGAIAYQLGASAEVATVIQWVSVALVGAVTVWAWLRASAERSYLVTVVASQLVSPLLWDHYAMLLLLPVAWLLDRRAQWAALLPLALAWPVVSLTPPVAYPVCLAIALVAPLIVRVERRPPRPLRPQSPS
jgi:alpha-1,2-mannosyltransferase